MEVNLRVQESLLCLLELLGGLLEEGLGGGAVPGDSGELFTLGVELTGELDDSSLLERLLTHLFVIIIIPGSLIITSCPYH